jgi:hypothetical protein
LSQGFKVEIAKEGLLGLVGAMDGSLRGVVVKLLEEDVDTVNGDDRAERLISLLLGSIPDV